MTTASAQQTSKDAAQTNATGDGNICQSLRGVLRTCTTRRELYRTSLSVLAQHFDAPYAGLQVEVAAGTLDAHVPPHTTADCPWKTLCSGLLLSARYRSIAVAKMHEASGVNDRFAVLAVPITESGDDPVGALVLVSRCVDRHVAETRLSELNALVSMIGIMATAMRPAPPSAAQQPQGLVKAAAFSSTHEMAFAMANDLKARTGSDQVCLGVVKRHRVTMLCMSGLDNLYPRSPGARLIVRAMEECLDAGHILCHQLNGSADDASIGSGHPLHRRWHEAVGNASVASVPLTVEGQCVAVLSLRRAANKPYEHESLEKIGAVVAPLAPGLLLVERANRHPLRLCWEACGQTCARWVRPGAWGRKLIAASLLGLTLWAALGTRQFLVSIPCEVAMADMRCIAAPFEGTIHVAHVKPGDHVAPGQVLVEMDTTDLLVERDKLLAQANIAELQLARAAMDKALAATAQAQSSLDMIRAELKAIEYRIERASVRAPEAGVVLQGDLAPRVGEVVPLGEPLLQLAPCDRWSVELQVPEYAAVYLVAGQTGQFTTNASPDQTQSCQLTRIYPSSEVADGKNVFVADADLQGPPPIWMRAGMQGIARIDAGERPIWWVGLHRLIDAIRLQLWKL